ncbi:MAG: tetratricopeptide repeat protein [Acidobacteriia bacterium]|nr:tetratricopeptide repeat protein [Terriglobia bacterium]
MAPFEMQMRTMQQQSRREAALRHIVVAMPDDGSVNCLDNLPADLRVSNWPASSETGAIVALIHRRLAECPNTVDQLLIGQSSIALREGLCSEAALPPPRPLPRPHYPTSFPASLNHRFVGRADDLFRIHFALSTLRGEPSRTAALSGSVEAGAGFGKTCLALEYAWRFGASHYPGGVFWLTADQDESGLEYQFRGMLSALRDEPTERRLEPGNVRAKLAAAFEAVTGTGKPVLYIVDNLPEPKPGIKMRPLEYYCPAMGTVTLLATTRARRLEARVHSLMIDALPRAASISLLTNGTELRPNLEDGKWEEIAAWAGDLPLALEVLNSSLRLGTISPAELLARCRSESVTNELSREMSALQGQVAPGALRGVTSALALSYDALAPAAQRAARLLSWFGSEPVPLELFHALGPGVDTAELRAALTGHSILASSGGRAANLDVLGTMHRVMADYIRNRVRTPRRDLALICGALASVMTPDRIKDTKHWSAMNVYLPHAARFFWGAMSDTHEDKAGPTGLIRLFSRATARFTSNISEPLRYLADACRQVLYNQRRYEAALKYAEAECRLTTKLFGPNSGPALESIVSVADVTRMAGDLDRALKLENEVLPKMEQTLGKDDPSTLLLRQNIAVTLNMWGDHERAKQYATETLDSKTALLGAAHPETISCQLAVARISYDSSDYDNAHKQYERCYRSFARALGSESDKALIARHGVAASLYELGDDLRALEHFKELSDANRRLLGPDHEGTLVSQHWIGIVLNHMGRYSAAESQFREVLVQRQRVFGSDSDDALSTQWNLAACLDAMGRHEEAGLLRESTLESRRRRALGPDDAKTLAAKAALANCLQDMGRYREAQPVYERTLEARRRVLGPEHPLALWSQDRLGDNLVAMGSFERAESEYREVLGRAQRALGCECAQALTFQADLARLLEAVCRYEEARRVIERRLEVSTRKYGATSAITLSSMNSLGSVLVGVGDLKKARPLIHSALETRVRIWGSENIGVADSYRTWGILLDAAGDPAGACEYFQKALAIRSVKLRYRHPDTTVSAWELFQVLHLLSDGSAAQVLMEHLVWLTDANPADLHIKQREIREKVRLALLPSPASN